MNPLIPDRPSSPAEAAGDSPDASVAFAERRWYYHAYRQAWGKGGSAYGLSRDQNQIWRLECILPSGSKRSLWLTDSYESALRVMDYCVHRDTAVKLALAELYEHANPDPLEKLITDGQMLGELPRRRVRLTVTIDVEMRGTDDELRAYVEQYIRTSPRVKAVKVTDLSGPRIEEPRPLREDEIYAQD